MSDRVLILGKGFIGSRLSEGFGCPVSDKNVSSLRDAQDIIRQHRPKTIINCIGYTGERNIDGCDLKPDKTIFANTFVPVILAEAALRLGVRLVHISSGCIYHYDYSQDRPITEERLPDFFELFYSRTKIYAERALDAFSRKFGVLIARIRVPLDDRPHPRNILTKLIGYRKIIDLPNSITYLPDLAPALRHLIRIKATGIYNVVNSGALRYEQLMRVYQSRMPSFKYEIIDSKKLDLVRTNLILSTRKLQRAGFKVRDISEVIEECVRNYLKY